MYENRSSYVFNDVRQQKLQSNVPPQFASKKTGKAIYLDHDLCSHTSSDLSDCDYIYRSDSRKETTLTDDELLFYYLIGAFHLLTGKYDDPRQFKFLDSHS